MIGTTQYRDFGLWVQALTDNDCYKKEFTKLSKKINELNKADGSKPFAGSDTLADLEAYTDLTNYSMDEKTKHESDDSVE